MPVFPPIAGVSLERYAILCAQMSEANHDEARELTIAEANGVAGPDWVEARQGWSERMREEGGAHGPVSSAFLPLYQAARTELGCGTAPMELGRYTRIAAELAFLKGPDGRQLSEVAHLARHGLTLTAWGEASGYWVPRVSDGSSLAAKEFRRLMQIACDRISAMARSLAPALTRVAPSAHGGGGAVALLGPGPAGRSLLEWLVAEVRQRLGR